MKCWRRQTGNLSWRMRGALTLFLGMWPWCGTTQVPTNELRTAAAVRSLTIAEARQPLRVRLRGVVTFFEEPLFSRFIQDETAGIYLFDSRLPVHLTPGQLVEVEGITHPGEYAPIVVPERIQVVGEAALPKPVPVTYDQLARGTEDSQFVEIAGIVRSVRFQDAAQHHLVEIATGGGRLSVYARQLPVAHAEEMPDSTVRVRGVCSTLFNHQRQLFAIRLMVPRPEDLAIEKPAPKEPYSAPARPLGSLLQFTPQDSSGHRVKVSGQVIYFQPGHLIYLQRENHGLEVQTRENGSLEIGDEVEVLGFPGRGDYTPVLEDAAYRRVAAGPALEPARVTPDEALKGIYDCRLIRISARLLDRARSGPDQYLLLEEKGFVFPAYLAITNNLDAFASLENGSRVTVTGVCKIDPGQWEAGDEWRAKAFRVRLRSLADVTVLALPPWWTLKRVLWAAGAVAVVAMAAFVWVAVLRREVSDRTQQLAAQIQERQRAERRREIEQERARVAHDLHDDLGAGLTEVNMLSSLAKSPMTSPEEKERYLTDLSHAAERMVTSLDEIVWAVNPRNDTVASLASYFGAYAQRLLDLASVACGLAVAEDLPDYPLDPRFRQEIFLAFKEALTNVVRHAAATQVWLRIAVEHEHLTVFLTDDGRGFNSHARGAGADGLANMQERMTALGGTCEVTPAPGKGTRVCFRVPLPRRWL